MSLLRGRLKCFYCNRQTNQRWTPGLKSFNCALCEATNHLDKNGEITDPPAFTPSKVQNNRRYAQPVGLQSNSAPAIDDGASPFCHTCTNNQQFITQSLAEYLPASTDPKYKEYEKNYAAYKANLERRYPPVCARCEPRVRAQIQQAGYVAKSDYMRRLIHNTKTRGPPRSGWQLKHFLGLVGVVAWTAVLLTHLTWNSFGLLSRLDDGLRDTDRQDKWTDCLEQAILERKVEPYCTGTVYDNLKLTVVLNWLILWWNPVMLYSANRGTGLGEFYKLQFLLIAVRTMTWYILDPRATLDTESTKAAHAVCLILNLVVSLVSIRVAKPKTKRAVDFSQDVPRLIDDDSQEEYVPGSYQGNGQIGAGLGTQGTPRSKFPVGQLAGKVATQPYSLPALPPDLTFDDPDAMDIDQSPSQATTLYREETPNAISSSFRSKSPPPMPLTSAQTPKTRVNHRRMSSKRRGGKDISDWMSITTAGDQEDALTVVDDDEDSADYAKTFVPSSMRNRKEYDFAGPTLHVHKDETGLEGMFKDIFGFGDDPLATIKDHNNEDMGQTLAEKGSRIGKPVSGASKPARQAAKSESPERRMTLPLPTAVMTVPVFIISISAIAGLGLRPNSLDAAMDALLIWAASIGAARLSEALRPSNSFFELSNVLLYVVEFMVCGYLALKRLQEASSAGRTANLQATSTGPVDPAVGPDMEMLEDLSSRGLAADGIPDVRQGIDTQQVIYVLLGWILLQEITLTWKNVRAKVKIA